MAMSDGVDWDEVLWNLESFKEKALALRQESFEVEGEALANIERKLANMAGGLANSFTLAAVIKLLSNEDFRRKVSNERKYERF